MYLSSGLPERLVEGGGAVGDVGEDGAVVDGGAAGVVPRPAAEVVEQRRRAGAGEPVQRLGPPLVGREADAGRAAGHVAEVADLLLHRHPADEVANPLRVRQRRVAVRERRHVQAQLREPVRVADLAVGLAEAGDVHGGGRGGGEGCSRRAGDGDGAAQKRGGEEEEEEMQRGRRHYC
jgi:hypothetical protein